MRWLVVALACALMLAGCASTKTDESASDATSTGDSGGTTQAGSGTAASSTASALKAGNATNRPPAISAFTTNQTVGGATSAAVGKAVKFTFNATDADKDNLTFRLVFGDKTTNATGKLPTKGVNHTYAAAGNYTAKVFVTDGKLAVNKTLLVTVTAPAPPAPPAPAEPTEDDYVIFNADGSCDAKGEIDADGIYFHDRGPYPGTGYLLGEGLWVYEESNGVDGLQLDGAFEGGTYAACINGDTGIF